ncbi:hypothetical protein NL676_022155 [Syzygium grande]|nr:hypothetical protein NL676_022155 [Syzygium grande]
MGGGDGGGGQIWEDGGRAREKGEDRRRRSCRGSNLGVGTLPSLEGEVLVVHGLGVELVEGVGGAAEGALVHLVEAGRDGLFLLRHGQITGGGKREEGRVFFSDRI